MTQAINFDDLKSAFEPKTQRAQLTKISGDAFTRADNKDELIALNKEINRLSDQLNSQKEQYQTLEHENQKALRHISLLMQEKSEHEHEFQKLHEDKMRSVRLINSKNMEVQTVRRELTKVQQLERQLTIKLSHAKGDAKKLSKTIDSQTKIIEQLQMKNTQLVSDINTIKIEQSLGYKMKEYLNGLFESTLQTISEFAVRLKQSTRPKSASEYETIRWTPVTKKLPKTATTVFVRNGYHADIAHYDPKTKSFQLLNRKKMDIREWAPVAHED